MERKTVNIFSDIDHIDFQKYAFVIGRFQALHRGHQALLKFAKTVRPNHQLAVLTFSPDPRDFFGRTIFPKLLDTSERDLHFKRCGVDLIIEFQFDGAFSQLSRSEFLTRIEQLGVHTLVHGEDFRLGNPNKQDKFYPDTMEIIAFSDEKIEGQKISTSQLETELRAANFSKLNKGLGYQYSVSGTVVYGKQIAQTLGYPTANIAVCSDKMLPLPGVFITQAIVDGVHYNSITHFGASPTFEREEMVIETHLLNYDGNLYGKHLEVIFLEKIRDIIRFNGPQEIAEQIRKDKQGAIAFFEREKH